MNSSLANLLETMANVKITDLPAAATTAGTDVLPIVQDNTTKKAALSLLPVSQATQTALAGKVNTSALGAANGVATLDSGGKLTSTQIPDIAVSDYLGAAANEAAMLALIGQQGDWCSRTDLGTNWIITGSNPSQIGSWTQLSYPASPVISVNGEVGAVVIDKSDVGLGNVDNTSDASKPISTATQTALNAKADASALTAHTGDTNNPHATTKAQVGLANVDNTSDVDKPVSTLVQTALNLKADQSPVTSSHTLPFNGSITLTAARYAYRNVSTTFNVSNQNVSVVLPSGQTGDVLILSVSLQQGVTMSISGGGFSATLANTNAQFGTGSALFILTNVGGSWAPVGEHDHANSNAINAGFMSSSDKIKLDGIQSGAEVNVNADWNANTGDAQILNRPDIPEASNNIPAALSVGGDAGDEPTFSRSNHSHPLPTPSDIGAFEQNTSPLLIGVNGNPQFGYYWDYYGQGEDILYGVYTGISPAAILQIFSSTESQFNNVFARGFRIASPLTGPSQGGGTAVFHPPEAAQTTLKSPEWSGSIAIGASFMGSLTGASVTGIPYVGNGMVAGAAVTIADRTCFLCPVVVPRAFPFTGIHAKLAAIATSTGNLRTGLYTQGANGLPDALVLGSSGDIPINPTIPAGTLLEYNTAAFNYRVYSGTYWIAIANFTGATVSLTGTGTDQSWLMSLLGFCNHTLTGSNPQALNTNIPVASGNVMPATMSRTLEYTTNTASNTTYRFRVSAPLLCMKSAG